MFDLRYTCGGGEEAWRLVAREVFFETRFRETLGRSLVRGRLDFGGGSGVDVVLLRFLSGIGGKDATVGGPSVRGGGCIFLTTVTRTGDPEAIGFPEKKVGSPIGRNRLLTVATVVVIVVKEKESCDA